MVAGSGSGTNMVFYIHIKAVVPVMSCLGRTGRNPSSEDAADQTCCNGRAECAGGCWGASTPGSDIGQELGKIRSAKPCMAPTGRNEPSLLFVLSWACAASYPMEAAAREMLI